MTVFAQCSRQYLGQRINCFIALMLVAAVAIPEGRAQQNSGSKQLAVKSTDKYAQTLGAHKASGPEIVRATGEPGYAGLAVVPSSVVKTTAPNHGHHDFGTLSVLDSEKATCIFVVRNTARRPIVLTHLRSSCGCTVAVIKGDSRLELQSGGEPNRDGFTLGAGARASITVTIDLKQMHAGYLEKSVSIYAKGKTGPVAVLEMSGNIKSSVEFSPAYVKIDTIWAGPGTSRVISAVIDSRLASKQYPTLASDSPYVSVAPVPPLDVPRRSGASDSTALMKLKREFTVTLTHEAPIGTTMGRIAFVRSSDVSPALNSALTNSSVLLIAHVHGDITVWPQILAFGAVDAGKTLQARIVLTGKTASSFSGLKIVSNSEYVTAKLSDQDPRPNLQNTVDPDSTLQDLDVTFVLPRTYHGSFSAQIKLVLSNGQFALVPVSAAIEHEVPHS